jgi:Arc/MetJ-type ribon-helix-helix transcriptional regulator
LEYVIEMANTSLNLDDADRALMDDFVARALYQNRSEAMRTYIKHGILLDLQKIEYMKQDGNGGA